MAKQKTKTGNNALLSADGAAVWIKAHTEEPKHGQKILMYCEREFKHQDKIIIGFYQKGDYENFISEAFNEDENINVTHWMPLPKAPKR